MVNFNTPNKLENRSTFTIPLLLLLLLSIGGNAHATNMPPTTDLEANQEAAAAVVNTYYFEFRMNSTSPWQESQHENLISCLAVRAGSIDVLGSSNVTACIEMYLA
jgi:hypothetical protein